MSLDDEARRALEWDDDELLGRLARGRPADDDVSTHTPLDCQCPQPTPTPTDQCARCLRVIAAKVRARRAEADR